MPRSGRNKLVYRFFLSFTLFLIPFVCISSPVRATTYECRPDHVVVWKDGKLGPEGKVIYPWVKRLVRFDDKTSTMWVTVSPTGPDIPEKMDLLQQGTDENDLVALSKSFDQKGRLVSMDKLTIRAWDKKTGLIFFLITSDSVLSGKCQKVMDAADSFRLRCLKPAYRNTPHCLRLLNEKPGE